MHGRTWRAVEEQATVAHSSIGVSLVSTGGRAVGRGSGVITVIPRMPLSSLGQRSAAP